MLDLIKILTSNEKTNACTKATNNPCTYSIRGNPIGNSNHQRSFADIAATPGTKSPKRIDQEIIFPYNLKERDIILAIVQIISKTPRNKEIQISNILATNLIG